MTERVRSAARFLLAAGLLTLAVLLLGGLSPASAATHQHGPQTAAHHQDTDGAAIVVSATSEESVPHTGQHGATPACCEGTACLSMHAGLAAVPPQPQPPCGRASGLAMAERLADGEGVAPALPPPRRSV